MALSPQEIVQVMRNGGPDRSQGNGVQVAFGPGRPQEITSSSSAWPVRPQVVEKNEPERLQDIEPIFDGDICGVVVKEPFEDLSTSCTSCRVRPDRPQALEKYFDGDTFGLESNEPVEEPTSPSTCRVWPGRPQYIGDFSNGDIRSSGADKRCVSPTLWSDRPQGNYKEIIKKLCEEKMLREAEAFGKAGHGQPSGQEAGSAVPRPKVVDYCVVNDIFEPQVAKRIFEVETNIVKM